MFYPWRLILTMRLAREENLAGPPGYSEPVEPAG